MRARLLPVQAAKIEARHKGDSEKDNEWNCPPARDIYIICLVSQWCPQRARAMAVPQKWASASLPYFEGGWWDRAMEVTSAKRTIKCVSPPRSATPASSLKGGDSSGLIPVSVVRK